MPPALTMQLGLLTQSFEDVYCNHKNHLGQVINIQTYMCQSPTTDVLSGDSPENSMFSNAPRISHIRIIYFSQQNHRNLQLGLFFPPLNQQTPVSLILQGNDLFLYLTHLLSMCRYLDDGVTKPRKNLACHWKLAVQRRDWYMHKTLGQTWCVLVRGKNQGCWGRMESSKLTPPVELRLSEKAEEWGTLQGTWAARKEDARGALCMGRPGIAEWWSSSVRQR